MARRHAFDWFRSGVLLTLLIAVSVGVARGQGARGGITGIVTDPSGAVVPGASITATNLNTGFARTTVSGSDGSFLFALLDPGRYRIEVVAQGFKRLTREPITVRVTETSDLRQLALEVGAVTETVNVTGEAPLLQTTQPTLGNVFDTRMIVELPLVTRNFTQLLTLQAGVVTGIPDAAAFGSGTQLFSVAGARAYDNSILIDGINAMGSTPPGGFSIPSPDALQEFKVQTNLYSAEFGRAGGASVNLVTKSGTNKWHGDVFEFLRNNALDANDFFYKASQMASGKGNKAPILRQNQFGGTVGGPLRKDKTFLFFSYQGTRQLNGAAPGLVFSNPVYPLLPAGDRSNEATLRAELGAIYGGRLGTFGLAGSVLPDGSNINPVAIKILQAKLPNGAYFLPAFPQSSLNDGQGGLSGGQVYSNASFSFPSPFDEDQYMVNIDHQISSRQTFSGKFFAEQQYVAMPAGNVPGFGYTFLPLSQNLVLTHTFTISPTLVNEVRAGYTRLGNNSHRADPLTAADVGMLPAPAASGRFPRLNIALSGLDMGADHYFNNSVENQYSISDTVSKVWGAHSLRFGGTMVRHQLNTNHDLVGSGQLILYGFPDFLIGQDAAHNGGFISNLLASFAEAGSYEKAYRFSDFSYFLQDDIKLRPNFTLNLGLRWDYFAWPHDIRGRMGGFDQRKLAEGLFGIPTAAQGYTGFTLPQQFAQLNPNFSIPAGVALVNNTLVDGQDFRNYGPRIGFAWEPRKHLAVRGGYGIFYPRTSATIAQAQELGPPFNATVLASFDPFGSLQDPFTFLNVPPADAFPTWTRRQFIRGQQATLFMSSVDPTIRNPYVQQWNLSLQYEITPNLLLEIAYMGSHGLRILNSMAGNQPAIASPSNPIREETTNTTDATNIQARSPVAGVVSDRGDAISETSAASKYNALLITVNKRMGHGLQFLSAFTYGRSSDSNSLNSEDCGLQGCVGNAQPPGDNTFNNHWGLSAWDRKVRSTTSFVYELPNPMKNQGALLRKFFGGWGTAAVMTFQSGTPIEFRVFQSQSAVKLQGYLTPNMAPGKTLGDVQGSGPIESRLTHYFNSTGLDPTTGATLSGSAFAMPGPLDFGQLGRTLPIRTPGEKSIDFMVSKRTAIRESMNLEFRAEFFNFFNWVNFGGPGSAVSNASFGIIGGTVTSPRIIQFALKLNF